MRYCNHCGNQLEEQELFCYKCGTSVKHKLHSYVHPTPHPNTSPEYMFPTTEAKVFAIITGTLFGLGLISGGLYSIIRFSIYTPWAIAGGCGEILAGIGCLLRSIRMVKIIKKEKTD